MLKRYPKFISTPLRAICSAVAAFLLVVIPVGTVIATPFVLYWLARAIFGQFSILAILSKFAKTQEDLGNLLFLTWFVTAIPYAFYPLLNSLVPGSNFLPDRLSDRPLLDHYYNTLIKPFLSVLLNPLLSSNNKSIQIIAGVSLLPRLALIFIIGVINFVFEVIDAAMITTPTYIDALLLRVFTLPLDIKDGFTRLLDIKGGFTSLVNFLLGQGSTSPKFNQNPDPKQQPVNQYLNVKAELGGTQGQIENLLVMRTTCLKTMYPGDEGADRVNTWETILHNRAEQGLGPDMKPAEFTLLQRLHDQVAYLNPIANYCADQRARYEGMINGERRLNERSLVAELNQRQEYITDHPVPHM